MVQEKPSQNSTQSSSLPDSKSEGKITPKNESSKKNQQSDLKKKKQSGKKSEKGSRSRDEEQKVVKSIKHGLAHIQSTYNNTMVTISDLNGNVLSWSSAGSLGFKGSKKSTPYAAGIVVEDVIAKIQKYGLAQVDVLVKGIGSGRESAIRALQAHGLEVLSIKDVTPIPHNGCRPRKVRRV